MDLQISKYQIIEELGRGGMGVVYKAFSPQMDSFVALKTILVPETKQLERFLREVRAMAKMNHPNIVKVYDINLQGKFPYFTMNYIEGISLKDFLKNTPLNVRLFSELMVKIGKAMQYAHEQGIIHRDLKPGNILIGKNKEPYIADFGLAKLTQTNSSFSSKGSILGTPKYMSPQQAKGEKVNALADVYSLGAIFYEMLVGKSLVGGKDAIDILFNVVHREPDLVRTVNAKLSKDLEIICHTAVAKDTQKRYQSARAFIEDIEKFLDGELISAKAANIWEQLWNKLQKNRTTMLVIVAIALLMLIAIWLFEKRYNLQVYLLIAQAKEWQQQTKHVSINKKMEIYIKISNVLEQAMDISSDNFDVKSRLIKVQKKMSTLAKEQKNYLLSFALLQQCKKLGAKNVNRLLHKLEFEKDQQEKKHAFFVSKIMKKLSKNTPPELINGYIFAIVKMQRPYVVKLLIPYLKSNNKSQRLLAIKTLGKLGNNYTKCEGKDSVEWLLDHLKKFRDKNSIKNNQQEVEEIIWSLGWLKDARSNVPVYEQRWIAGPNSLLWNKTKIPHKWIPLKEKVSIKNAFQYNVRGEMKQTKGDLIGAIADYNKAIVLDPKFPKSYNSRGNTYNDMKEYAKAIADYNKAIALNPTFSEAYSNRGNTYQEINQYIKAIADYTQAITLNPKFIDAYNNRGNTYYRTKKYAKAIIDYNKAIALDPKRPDTYSNRGLAYEKTNQYTKAIADYNKAIALNPKFSEAYSNRGNAYYHIEEYTKAMVDHTKAIALNPKFAEAYANRGLAYLYIKEYTKAIADCSQAISLAPGFPGSYVNRGLVYFYMQEYTKAIADYNKAIALNPKFAEAYNNRGRVYFYMKKYLKSITDYNKAIALNPKLAGVYNNRGRSYLYIKEHVKAIADLNRAIALYPKYSKAYFNRANVYQDMNQYVKALADYNQAIVLDPKFAGAYNDRGNIYLTTKKYLKALTDYNQAIALNPKTTEGYNNRGKVYYEMGEYAKAIANYNQAIALNPKNAEAYNNKANAYQDMKQYAKAIANYTQAIALNPKFIEAYNNRGLIYRRTKEYTKAIADYTQAIAFTPKNSGIYINRALVYLDLEQHQKCYRDLQMFLKLAPKHPMVPKVYALINDLRKSNLIIH